MSNAIALVSTNVPAHVLQGTGLGNENVGQNVTIPRVKLLQKMSDEVDKYNSKYIQGAEPGHFLNSLTGQNYGEELYVISLLFKNEFVESTPGYTWPNTLPFDDCYGESCIGRTV